MSKALDRAKDLAKKTNATVIVVNETTNDVFAVMTIDQYEKLISGSIAAPSRTDSAEQTTSPIKLQVVGSEQSVVSDKQQGTNNKEQTTSDIGRLTEQELLARMSEQVREWRSAQVNREQLVLAEMPAEIKVSGTRDEGQGKYNLSGKVDFKVDNLEDEERFFLDDLS